MKQSTWREAALRERLSAAGLLETSTRRVPRPPAEQVAAARAAAGHGTPASELVSQQRE